MLRFNLTFFGGRGAGSGGGLPMSYPGGGGGRNRNSGPMDQAPGEMATAAEALGPQGRAMNITAAVSGANPYHDLGVEYQENCQRCVVATEARLRGYDVQALPTYDNDPMPYQNRYMTNFVLPNSQVINTIRRTTARANQNEVESQMAGYGDGARAFMAFNWKGGGGHVINVVQSRGRTRYYDGQNGTEVSASHLFGAISTSSQRGIQLTRVDNLQFSDTVNRSLRPHT